MFVSCGYRGGKTPKYLNKKQLLERRHNLTAITLEYALLAFITILISACIVTTFYVIF